MLSINVRLIRNNVFHCESYCLNFGLNYLNFPKNFRHLSHTSKNVNARHLIRRSIPIIQKCYCSEESKIPAEEPKSSVGENIYEAHTLAGDAKFDSRRHSRIYDVNIMHLVGTVTKVKVFPRITIPDQNWVELRVRTEIPIFHNKEGNMLMVRQNHRVVIFVQGVVKYAERVKCGCRVAITGHVGYYKPRGGEVGKTSIRKHAYVGASHLSLLGYVEEDKEFDEWRCGIIYPENQSTIDPAVDPEDENLWNSRKSEQSEAESSEGLSYSELQKDS